MRDKFDIKIRTEGGEGYHSCSGGQRSRINFAIALALQSLQASRGTRVDLFVCDEPFESVDEAGIDGIIKVLNTFAEEHDLCIYVITHLDGLKSRFRNILEVVKARGVSTIE